MTAKQILVVKASLPVPLPPAGGVRGGRKSEGASHFLPYPQNFQFFIDIERTECHKKLLFVNFTTCYILLNCYFMDIKSCLYDEIPSARCGLFAKNWCRCAGHPSFDSVGSNLTVIGDPERGFAKAPNYVSVHPATTEGGR